MTPWNRLKARFVSITYVINDERYSWPVLAKQGLEKLAVRYIRHPNIATSDMWEELNRSLRAAYQDARLTNHNNLLDEMAFLSFRPISSERITWPKETDDLYVLGERQH
jgi:hypothetical protein